MCLRAEHARVRDVLEPQNWIELTRVKTKYLSISAGCLWLALASVAFVTPASAADQPKAVTGGASSSRSFTGKVVETMDAGGYTYVLVDTGKDQVWAAGPKASFKKGDTVSIKNGMPMANYHSNTLDRDFKLVYFAGRLQGSGDSPAAGNAGTLPAGHPALPSGNGDGLPAGHPAVGNPASTQVEVDLSGIKKAQGGKTIQEIYTDGAKLKGKQVTVRGKVVKFSAMIMGKNWMHLKDGTGATGSNDLTVTSSAKAKVGDTVLVTGPVSTDKDFGFGYKFAVILDDAKVVVE